MKRHVILVLAVLVIALVALLRQLQHPASVSSGFTSGNRISDPVSESVGPSSDCFVPARTKSKIREIHHKPTVEETTGLLRRTILPLVDLPAHQPVIERVAQINQLIKNAGVEPHKLRLILSKSDPATKLTFSDELKIRNVPVADVLKYVCGSTKFRYRIRENGIVEFATQLEIDDPPPVSSIPAESMPTPSGELDIFGNDPNAPNSNDPFAEH